MAEPRLFEESELPPVVVPAAQGSGVGSAGKALLRLLADGEWHDTDGLDEVMRRRRGYSTNVGMRVPLGRLRRRGLVERQVGASGFEWRIVARPGAVSA
jgi:hypothetical protein